MMRTEKSRGWILWASVLPVASLVLILYLVGVIPGGPLHTTLPGSFVNTTSANNSTGPLFLPFPNVDVSFALHLDCNYSALTGNFSTFYNQLAAQLSQQLNIPDNLITVVGISPGSNNSVIIVDAVIKASNATFNDTPAGSMVHLLLRIQNPNDTIHYNASFFEQCPVITNTTAPPSLAVVTPPVVCNGSANYVTLCQTPFCERCGRFDNCIFNASNELTNCQLGTKVLGAGGSGFQFLAGALVGFSLSMSNDGNTIAAGGPADSFLIGATWIFGLEGTTRVQVGTKLVGTGYIQVFIGQNPQAVYQGWSISISGDGTILASGAPGDNLYNGATWIFERNSTGGWNQHGSKLIGSVSGGPQINQGYAVSLSNDGTTLAVGAPAQVQFAPFVHIEDGVFIFIRNATTGNWTQQGPQLHVNDTGGFSAQSQGFSVSLSGDGNTLVFSALYYCSVVNCTQSSGATFVFVRRNSTWTQQGPVLIGSDFIFVDAFVDAPQGYAVTVSADGNTLATSAPNDGLLDQGAVWVFRRNGTVWTQMGPKLSARQVALYYEQGNSLSLSANGNILAYGGRGVSDNFYIGAVWVFLFDGQAWIQVSDKLVGTGAVGFAAQGHAVALSTDGAILAESGYADNEGRGAVWFFSL